MTNVGLCEIYKWRNDDGSISFTDDLSSVPEKYRDQIEIKKYRSSENNDDTKIHRGYNDKTVEGRSVTEYKKEPQQELTEEEKRKLEKELRGIWNNMKKALKKRKITK